MKKSEDSRYFSIVFLVMIIVFLSCLLITTRARDQEIQLITLQDPNYSNEDNESPHILKASEVELPDEVYTFTAPQDEASKLVALEEEYVYYLSVELVTPHDCLMRISIEDPAGYRFNVFENDMFYEPEYGRSYEVPFGTASSGIYNITFHVESTSNLNIHLKVEKAGKCLYDKMGVEAIENIIFYEVTTFDDDQAIYIEHDVALKKNTMYALYIGRVSAISKEENSVIKVNYTIEDPNGVEFSLYSQNFLAGVNDVNETLFGTSINGSHSIKITIYCNVAYINVAYTIVEDYSLSGTGEENEPDVVPSDEGYGGNLNNKKELFQESDTNNSGEVFNTTTELPPEMTIGTIVSVSGTLGTMIIALINHRKKNEIKL